VFIGLAQAKLRDQVSSLLDRFNSGLAGDQSFTHITEALPKAADQMKEAEADLKAQKTKEALGPELHALKYLQDAEQAYEIEVRRQQAARGWWRRWADGQDLADLFQMTLDRNANQYELQQRAQQQNTDQQVDEVAQRLRELARRQLQQAEQQMRAQRQEDPGQGRLNGRSRTKRIRWRASSSSCNATRSGRASSARISPTPPNACTSQPTRCGARHRQSSQRRAVQQAMQALQDAQRLLDQTQQDRAGQNMANALQQADALVKQQQDIASRVSKLDQAGADKDAQTKQLTADKDQERQKLNDLQQQLGQLANQATANNARDAARKAQEAAASANDNMLKEKIEYSKEAMSAGSQYTKPLEDDISNGMQTFRQKVADAASASDQGRAGQGMSRRAQSGRTTSCAA